MTETRYNAYELAHMAGVRSPDSLSSPGAEWLLEVASAAEEITDPDSIDSAANALVPVYTHPKWLVFTDLCAWQEDLEDWPNGGCSDLDTASNWALYQIAARLLQSLISEPTESESDES